MKLHRQGWINIGGGGRARGDTIICGAGSCSSSCRHGRTFTTGTTTTTATAAAAAAAAAGGTQLSSRCGRKRDGISKENMTMTVRVAVLVVVGGGVMMMNGRATNASSWRQKGC